MEPIKRTKATGLAICGLTQCTNKVCRKREECKRHADEIEPFRASANFDPMNHESCTFFVPIKG